MAAKTKSRALLADRGVSVRGFLLLLAVSTAASAVVTLVWLGFNPPRTCRPALINVHLVSQIGEAE